MARRPFIDGAGASTTPNKLKKYKLSKEGGLVEVVGLSTLSNTEIGLSGNKSDVRNIEDLQRNDTVLVRNIKEVQDLLTTESGTRSTSDTTLQNNIDAEETARISAVNTVSSNLTSEESSRTIADSGLDARVSTLETAPTYAPLVSSATVPLSPNAGDQWYNTDTKHDGDSSQWIDISTDTLMADYVASSTYTSEQTAQDTLITNLLAAVDTKVSKSGDTMSGDLIPVTDNVHSLGSATNKWKDVHIGPGSLYIGGQKVLESDADTIVITADTDQNVSIRTKGTGDLEIQTTTGAIQLKSDILVTPGKGFNSSDGSNIPFHSGLDLKGEQVQNLGSPVNAGDASTKGHADGLMAGEVTARTTAIAAEASSRTTAIATEATARTTAIATEATARTTAIATEATARTIAIATEATARTTAIATEATARTIAIDGLAATTVSSYTNNFSGSDLGSVTENGSANINAGMTWFDGTAFSCSGTPGFGLTVNSAGVVSGTVSEGTSSSASTFTITCTHGSTSVDTEYTINRVADNDIPVWSTSAGSMGAVDADSFQVSATDQDSGSLTYTIVSGSLPSSMSLGSATGLVTGTNPGDGNTYEFTVAASDGSSTINRTFSFTSNSKPNAGVTSANTGDFQTGTSSTIVLTGSGTDPQGDNLTYSWSATGPGTLSASSGATVNLTLPYTGGDTIVSVIANDGTLSSDTVTRTYRWTDTSFIEDYQLWVESGYNQDNMAWQNRGNDCHGSHDIPNPGYFHESYFRYYMKDGQATNVIDMHYRQYGAASGTYGTWPTDYVKPPGHQIHTVNHESTCPTTNGSYQYVASTTWIDTSHYETAQQTVSQGHWRIV